MKPNLFFLILIIIFHFSLLTAQETIIDTVYSIAYLDGDITHSPGLGYFGIGANSPYGIAGDYYSPYLWDYFFNRSFFAFTLPVIPEGYSLTSVYIYIYINLHHMVMMFLEYIQYLICKQVSLSHLAL